MFLILLPYKMLGFFDILLIIILGFFLLGYLMRWFLPMIMRWWTRHFFNQMGMQDAPSKKKKNKVEIKSAPRKIPNKSIMDEIGEYTDYEEIE
ncbi:MAG: hypothetical protein GYA75_00525 [Bacteroidales bacterium]|nr:hypothetical protein [Bacteroidales bacterium]HOE59975.1 hypothetical protein [Bacteroidales bacterium]HPL34877.1 hypothetical protein [Bacteroidales bacterium]